MSEEIINNLAIVDVKIFDKVIEELEKAAEVMN